MFFLLNHGGGYTDSGLKDMTVDEMEWHVRSLAAKIKGENEARAQAVQAQQRASSRWKVGRR